MAWVCGEPARVKLTAASVALTSDIDEMGHKIYDSCLAIFVDVEESESVLSKLPIGKLLRDCMMAAMKSAGPIPVVPSDDADEGGVIVRVIKQLPQLTKHCWSLQGAQEVALYMSDHLDLAAQHPTDCINAVKETTKMEKTKDVLARNALMRPYSDVYADVKKRIPKKPHQAAAKVMAQEIMDRHAGHLHDLLLTLQKAEQNKTLFQRAFGSSSLCLNFEALKLHATNLQSGVLARTHELQEILHIPAADFPSPRVPAEFPPPRVPVVEEGNGNEAAEEAEFLAPQVAAEEEGNGNDDGAEEAESEVAAEEEGNGNEDGAESAESEVAAEEEGNGNEDGAESDGGESIASWTYRFGR